VLGENCGSIKPQARQIAAGSEEAVSSFGWVRHPFPVLDRVIW